MQLRLSFRGLIAICVGLAMLLGIVGFVQYRWSKRVGLADLRRERERLDTSVNLFATRFNRNIADVVGFLQNDVQNTWVSGASLPAFPGILKELYFVDTSGSQSLVQRIDASGRFTASPVPKWMSPGQCIYAISPQPLAITSPVFELPPREKKEARRVVLRRSREGRCFVALLDENYIKGTLVPRLLRETFGASSMEDYDFAIVSRGRVPERVYGPELSPDTRKPFFAVSFRNLPLLPISSGDAPASPSRDSSGDEHRAVQLDLRGAPHFPSFPGDGIWELQVAHHGEPLAAAFRHARWRDLLLGFAAELLLGAAIILLAVSAYRIQRVAQQRMQFVAAVSHELRTPISSISMLSRNQADGLVIGADKVSQYGELIHQQSRRLSEMIEQTLQYAGIHSNLGTRAHASVDVKALIAAVLAARQEELDREEFVVEQNVADGLPAAHGDHNLLRIALDNLLSNAIKYAKRGRWIGIRAEHSFEKAAILIDVSDKGPGVECVDRERLFEPFYRGRGALETGAPGSGIGLSLVRSAAEAHGGTITVVSRPGQGSTFTLRIPV